MITRLALLLALLALGCNDDVITVATLSGDLTPATIEAVNAWNAALAHGPCPEVELWLVNDAEYADATIEWEHRRDGWYASEREGQIAVSPQAYRRHPERLPGAIAHEIGHVLIPWDGWHSDDPGDVMWHKSPNEPTITIGDVYHVCKAHRGVVP